MHGIKEGVPISDLDENQLRWLQREMVRNHDFVYLKKLEESNETSLQDSFEEKYLAVHYALKKFETAV